MSDPNPTNPNSQTSPDDAPDDRAPDDRAAGLGAAAQAVVHGELVKAAERARRDSDGRGNGTEDTDADSGDAVTSPAKVMRIGSMVKALLEEVRAAPLDEPSRERLAEIYERSVVELAEALSPDLQEELRSLALPFTDGEIPSEGEIRVAKAQLVGWLEGLFHGIQATLFAQQVAARQQLEQMRQLPGGAQLAGQPAGQLPGNAPTPGEGTGTYL